MSTKSVSIIIPSYNEALRLPPTLDTFIAFFRKSNDHFFLKEIIIIDDGSKDATAESVRAFKEQLPISLIKLPENHGKGYAVRAGVLASQGDFVFMYDADGATPIEELTRFIHLMSTADVVIGCRLSELDRQVEISFFRRVVGSCFHFICLPLLPGIKDASCGAKLFKREVAYNIFRQQKLDRFAFDIEILWLARNLGFNVVEVNVEWHAVPGSKVNVYLDSLEMFFSVMGLYKRQIWQKVSNSKKP